VLYLVLQTSFTNLQMGRYHLSVLFPNIFIWPSVYEDNVDDDIFLPLKHSQKIHSHHCTIKPGFFLLFFNIHLLMYVH